MDEALLKGSAHSRLECVACHKTATAPHDERLPAVSCAGCHDKQRAVLGGGIHGSRRAETGSRPPTCAACHGTHDVKPAGSLSTQTCAACHQKQVSLYRESVHGRSRQRGDLEAATCNSCHGATHTVVARSDPESPVYHLNLPRTCAAGRRSAPTVTALTRSGGSRGPRGSSTSSGNAAPVTRSRSGPTGIPSTAR
ncbi:MAG: cytochrome c3 family protein [Candidatus Rokubacteria bacterium]|nr:cytochrome c3 family protein [Candidatus Rokubacteria bacterium]